MVQSSILVTGAGGFVGQHLLPVLKSAFPMSRIIGSGLHPWANEPLDITSPGQALAVIARSQPDFCVHLAGITSIHAARADPMQAWQVNLHGAINIAGAILATAPQCRMIFVSSGECYGSSFNSGLALDETAPLAPLNLYAATKAAAELALGAMVGDGLQLLRLRPFNHTGPGQREDFAVPAFAGQIARIEAGLAPPIVAVGALDPEREFLDIRDVCNAYVRCIEKSDKIPSNQTINIANGQAVRIGKVLEILLAMAKCPIAVRPDPSKIRSAETARATGNPMLARTLLGWVPHFQLEETLATVLNFARDGNLYTG